MKRIERNTYNILRKSISADTICVEIPTEYTHEGRQGIHEMLTIEKHMRASSILWNDFEKCYCIHYVPVVDEYTEEIRKQQEAQDIDQIIETLPKSDMTWYGYEKPTEDTEETETTTEAKKPTTEAKALPFEIRQIDAWNYDGEWSFNDTWHMGEMTTKAQNIKRAAGSVTRSAAVRQSSESTETQDAAQTDGETHRTLSTIEYEEDKTMKPNVIFEKKVSRNFEQTWSSDNKTRVYEDLAHELINKKLCECSYIRSITRKQLYNGFVKITVSYDNGDRRIYTINDH